MPYHDMYLALSPESQTAFYMIVCYGLGQFQCRLDQFSTWLNNPLSGAAVAQRKELCRFVLYDLRPLLKSVEQQLVSSSYEETWEWLSEEPGLNEEAAIEVLLQWLDTQGELIHTFEGELEGEYEVEEDAPSGTDAYDVVDERTVEITPEPLSGATPVDPRLAFAWNHSEDHREWLRRCDDLFQSHQVKAPFSLLDALAPAHKNSILQALIDTGMDKMSFGEHSSITWVRGLLFGLAGQWLDSEQCLRRLGLQQAEHSSLLAQDRLVSLLGSQNWSNASGFLQDLERKRPGDSFTPSSDESCRRLLSFNLFGLSLRTQRGFNEERNVLWPLCLDEERHEEGLRKIRKFSGDGFARLVDSGVKNQRRFLSFESQGGSVLSESLVSGSSVFMTDAAERISKIAEALHRFHEAGCVHGAIHRGSLEQVGYGNDLQWTGACPGIDYAALTSALSETSTDASQCLAPELRDGGAGAASKESDYFAFGVTLLGLLKEAGQDSSPTAEALKACSDPEPSKRKAAFLGLLGDKREASPISGLTGRSVTQVSVKLGPPKSAKKLNGALSTLLGILENPKDRDEACFLGTVKKSVEEALQIIKKSGSQELYQRLADRIPSDSVLKQRRKMIYIPQGQVKASSGKTVTVPPFLIESQGRFAIRPKLHDAKQTLRKQGLALPTLKQWLRILELRPSGFVLPKDQQEWIRETERRGRHSLARAIAFFPKTKDPWTWPYQTLWLPSHRPGPETSARGVIDLRGS